MAKKKVITSGFVYIWFDKKHKRFYIGSHWEHQMMDIFVHLHG